MHKVLFLSRTGFLCNIAFLASWAMRYFSFASNSALASTLIVMGQVMAVVLNIILMFLYLGAVVTKRSLRTYIPGWLIISNILFFIFQAILFIK